MKKSFLIVLCLFTVVFITVAREYSIDIPAKTIDVLSGHLNLGGTAPDGKVIGFNSYFMTVDNKPFVPVMGEFHYSRFQEKYWEEQILKMKSGGINVIATYVFWNIHESKEGVFDWSGNRDLRRFLDLCKKHNIFALVRVGPFCHGEIRNGGLPDWLYGRPFEIRSNDEGYLFYVRRLYHNIGLQLKGLLFKDGGPVMGIQLENELQHSAAPWAFTYAGQAKEMTTANYDAEITKIGVDVQDKTSVYNELGTKHLANLKKIAKDEGMDVPLYTVTGWGRAAVLENEAIPVTAAYPYPFWANPSKSPFFLFKEIQKNPDYSPVRYDGSRYPSFCAEMGVGIQITYSRRPKVVAEASEALMLRTLGSGANGIGYYMYHGGLTPVMEGGLFFSDEPMGVPKISYDFQAPIGEYGKTRDSYFFLRLIHLFTGNFGDVLAPMGVVLPENNSKIKPDNREDLRFSVRSDGKSGFVFLNNFQDHDERIDQPVSALKIKLTNETIAFPSFVLKKNASAILPFNLKIGDALLKYATVQPLAITKTNGLKHYIFFSHEGISPEFVFAQKSIKKVSASKKSLNGFYYLKPVIGIDGSFTITTSAGEKIIITTLSEKQALLLNQPDNGVCITEATLMKNGNKIELHSLSNSFSVVLPSEIKPDFGKFKATVSKGDFFTEYRVVLPEVKLEYDLKKVSSQRFTYNMSKSEFSENLSDIILEVDYVGDNAVAFIDGKMVNDNLYYGKKWNIGLKQYADQIDRMGMYFYFRPMPKDASYLVDFVKEDIPVFSGKSYLKVNGFKAIPEYSLSFSVSQ